MTRGEKNGGKERLGSTYMKRSGEFDSIQNLLCMQQLVSKQFLGPSNLGRRKYYLGFLKCTFGSLWAVEWMRSNGEYSLLLHLVLGCSNVV